MRETEEEREKMKERENVKEIGRQTKMRETGRILKDIEKGGEGEGERR